MPCSYSSNSPAAAITIHVLNTSPSPPTGLNYTPHLGLVSDIPSESPTPAGSMSGASFRLTSPLCLHHRAAAASPPRPSCLRAPSSRVASGHAVASGQAAPPVVRHARVGTPDRLCAVTRRCLANDDSRYQTWHYFGPWPCLLDGDQAALVPEKVARGRNWEQRPASDPPSADRFAVT